MSAPAKQNRIEETALRNISRGPLPASRKIFVPGTLHSFIRVPMREISQTATRLGTPAEGRTISTPPLVVYDSSGPYTDLDQTINVRQGLDPIRSEWIRAREDVQELSHISSEYGRQRLHDSRLDDIRFVARRKPIVARSGLAVTQLHYARRGIVTPEMEFVAIRENQRLEASLNAQHPGNSWGASIPKRITTEFVRHEAPRAPPI